MLPRKRRFRTLPQPASVISHTNKELALLRIDLEIGGVRQEGRSLTSVFLRYVTTDCAGLCGAR